MANHSNAKELFEKYYFQMHNRFPVTFTKGKGCKLYDDEGNEYLDVLAGIAVDCLGHAHPRHVQAIREQAEKLIHVSNFFYNEPQSLLAEKLSQLAGMDRVFFCNSGLEANEGALKLVRKYAHERGRTGKVYSFEGCFHGRSIATIAMGKPVYQEGFSPLPEGFEMLPFNDVDALQKISDNDVAVFVEFVQGEGGVRPAQKDFIDALARVCKEKGVLLVADEIQTGIGRTGKWFAYQHYGVTPDVMTLAKGLAGGFPIGAVLASDEVSKTFKPGNHSTTFGGNPLACAASLATLEAIEDEHLVENTREVGSYIVSKIEEALKGNAVLKEVRGLGLLIGVEFTFACKELVDQLLKNKVVANCTAGNVLRLAPPLLFSKSDADRLVAEIAKSMQELSVNANY